MFIPRDSKVFNNERTNGPVAHPVAWNNYIDANTSHKSIHGCAYTQRLIYTVGAYSRFLLILIGVENKIALINIQGR